MLSASSAASVLECQRWNKQGDDDVESLVGKWWNVEIIAFIFLVAWYW